MNTKTPVAVIETPVYNFNDLDDDAKAEARNWWREGALDYEWWDSTFEDAETLGLKITGFELDRGRHATGQLTKYVGDVIRLIMENHGKDCETYKTALEYQSAVVEAENHDNDTDEIEDEFLKSILEDYSIMLQHEYEYQLSDEVADDMITANGYTFTETGKREG